MNKLWFTADSHFGHVNILNYTKRPWSTVDQMNEALVENWNAVVAPEDTVIVLGDFAMGVRKDTCPIGKRLNGHKILVPGNHDICWDAGRDGSGRPSPGKLANQVAKFCEWSGFEQVLQPLQWLNIREDGSWIVYPYPQGIEGTIVALSHLPPIECGDHKDGVAVYENEVRFMAQRPTYPPEGIWILCGHVHEAWWIHGRVINVGVDVWNYKPVAAETLRQIILRGEEESSARS